MLDRAECHSEEFIVGNFLVWLDYVELRIQVPKL